MASSLAPSTTSRPSIVATATAVLALTTPFVEPPECTGFWQLTSTTLAWTTNQTLATLLLSDAPLEQYASCQPSGWASVVPTSRYSFSPAVCPGGWAYFSLASTVSSPTAAFKTTFSTAWCCAHGYTLRQYGLNQMEPISTDTDYCFRSFSGTRITATLSNDPESTQVVTSGYQVHTPWQISWHESDRSTLIPSPPDLTSEKMIPTWTGQIIPPGMYDMDTGEVSDSAYGMRSIVYFLMIGLPVILVSLIACCVGCIIYHRPKAKARRAQRRRETELRAFNPQNGHTVAPEAQEPPSYEESREQYKEAQPVGQPR